MLSRVAESLFWMSRYIERAENTARFLDVNINLLLDLNQIVAVDTPNYWKPLILVTSDEERFEKLHEDYSAKNVIDFLVFNRSNPNSIYSCILLARENARSIIESISSEMWEQINNLYHFLQRSSPEIMQESPYQFYSYIRNASHLFQGITDCTLLHNEGWDFVQAGKFLERADNTARLVDVKYHLLQTGKVDSSSVDVIQWIAVLKSCSALEAFRKVYSSHIEPETILQFLVLEQAFPRSIFFSVAAADEALLRISGNALRKPANTAERLIGRLRAELEYTTVEDIYNAGLHSFLEGLEKRLIKVGDQIYQNYFSYHNQTVNFSELEMALFSSNILTVGDRAIWSQAQQEQQQQQQ
ncbi:MAG TPA: alpha-E domain-containing protein [Chloroflexia bacterium]|nr:alpha-E domain-containing protein [Chloroflexia bacterium]